MARIIHTADLHFDTPYTARFSKKQAELRRSELKDVFSEIISKTIDADVLIISGDLFDGKLVSADTVDFLKRKFSEIAPKPVFIAAGNHDPYTSDSVYATEDFGENVHIFGGEMEYIDLNDLKLRIHGISFMTEASVNTRLTELELSKEFANILVMHGDVNPIGDSRYNPVLEDALFGCGADYAALGHIHKFSGIRKSPDKCTWAYSGNPEGRGFDETGDRGIVVGTVEKGNAELEFLKISKRTYYDLNLDISEATDESQVYEMIKSLLSEGTKNDIYRINLEGRTNLLTDTAFEVLKEKVKELAFYTELSDKTTSAYDYAAMATEQSLRGRFVLTMLDKLNSASEEEKEVIELALKIGVDALM